MARLLKIDNTTTPKSLKQMTDSEYDYAINKILLNFVSDDTDVGCLTTNSSHTSIGSFTDTYRPYTVGDHPIGTDISSTVYDFYQNLGSATESLTLPVQFETVDVEEQEDAELNSDLITKCLANLCNEGIGSYLLQPTTPTGGTWVQKRTITDSHADGSANTYLWRKISDSAPSTIRPIKINSTDPKSIKEMSDSEIESLTNRMRNQIVSTGIGQYRISASTPTPGTWVTRGNSFNDTRHTISTQSYTGFYTGSYTGSYTGTSSASFTGTYTSYYSGTYTGFYTTNYAGSYAQSYAGSYSGSYARYYAGYLNGYYTGSYTGYYTSYYTGYYSTSYAGNYTGSYAQNYTGTYTATYSGSYSGTYTGAYSGTYSGLTLDAATTVVSTISLWLRTA